MAAELASHGEVDDDNENDDNNNGDADTQAVPLLSSGRSGL